MFWNNLVPSSLKLRLAIAFAILFFVSSSIVYFITVSSLVYLKNRESLVEMGNIARNIEKIYVMGAKYNSNTIVHPGKDCPPEIREQLLKKYPGAKILYILTMDVPDGQQIPKYQTYYLMRNKKIYEVIQLQNGDFSSKAVNPDNDRRTMNRYLLLTLGEYADENFSIDIRNPDGSVYLSSKSIKRPFSTNEKISYEGDYQTYQEVLPDGKIVKLRKRMHHISAVEPQYIQTFFGVLILIAVTGILVSWLIAGRFIRGVRRMTSEMKLVAASGDYGRKISRMQMDKDHEIRELMETYNEMNEKTRILMEDLKMVSNNVAHDLRTPITRISGTMEELLRDRTLPEKAVTSSASVIEECMHMKAMINTILDISRVNANPEVLKKEKLDLCMIAEDFYDIMHPEVERKGLKMILRLPNSQINIFADKMCVQRIISNLVENALKFTEQGTITLSIEERETKISLTVEDTGCGIPKDSLERIFDRFYRCDASRKYPGNGLGLSLVQALVNAHNWTIECQSSEGKGTLFRIVMSKTA